LFPGNYYLLVGYKFIPRSGTIALNPSLVFKFDNQLSKQIDFNVIADVNHQYQLGVSYRHALTQLPGQTTGLQFLFSTFFKRFQFNYVAEVSLNNTQASHFGSHELALIYRICYREKPQCPAFE
jgi:hypothetical protein